MALSEDNQQVCITLPKDIVEKIEKDAKRDMRSRSKQIAKVVIEQYEHKK